MIRNLFSQSGKRLRREVLALYFACRDPRTSWLARALVGLVVAYALSPIDLIPDFIPVLGLLDDLILVPIGVVLVLRLIPPEVMAEARQRAEHELEVRPRSRLGFVIVVSMWLMLAAIAGLLAYRHFH